jgi:broad specificity phosphatase PhoE
MATWVACVAHVVVDQDNKSVSVKKIWQTIDCGTVVHPDGAQAQAAVATLRSQPVTRIVSRVCSAVSHWREQHSEETILIASHGLVFYALVESLTGTKVMSGNAEPRYFSLSDDGWTVTPLAKS